MVSALAICGVVAGNSAALAAPVDSPDIPFSGTITNMCTFGAPNAGTIGDVNGPGDTIIASYRGNGGTTASVNLACNGNAQVAVSDFQQVSVPTGMTLNTANSGWWLIRANDGNGQFVYRRMSGSTDGSMTLTGPFSQNINVDIDLTYTTAVKPGTYSYTTKLTATPQ